MKRLTSILLLLFMALSVSVAFAEEKAKAQSMEGVVTKVGKGSITVASKVRYETVMTKGKRDLKLVPVGEEKTFKVDSAAQFSDPPGGDVGDLKGLLGKRVTIWYSGDTVKEITLDDFMG